MVIVDGKIFDDRNVFQYTYIAIFSPDSQHLAYMSRIGTNWFAVVDGIVEKQSENIFSAPIFSPENKRLIYLKQNKERTVPVCGELKGKEYDRFLTCAPFLNAMGVMGSRTFAFDGGKTIYAIALQGDEILRLELEIGSE